MKYVVKERSIEEGTWYLDTDGPSAGAYSRDLAGAARFDIDQAVFQCKRMQANFPERQYWIAPMVKR